MSCKYYRGICLFINGKEDGCIACPVKMAYYKGVRDTKKDYERPTVESKKEKYDMAIKAIHDIKEKLWEIDIPSPTIPEYVEHHEQVKSVLIVIYNWLTKLEEAENE